MKWTSAHNSADHEICHGISVRGRARNYVYHSTIIVSQQNTPEEMGWKQPLSPIYTDNSSAAGVANNNIVTRKFKAMDRRMYWLRCRNSQGQFWYYWAPGLLNWGNYSTKHHPQVYHESKRTQFSRLIVHTHDV